MYQDKSDLKEMICLHFHPYEICHSICLDWTTYVKMLFFHIVKNRQFCVSKCYSFPSECYVMNVKLELDPFLITMSGFENSKSFL